MKKISILIYIIILGCVTKADKKDRLYLKEIKVDDKNIEWFYYSNVVSTSADYVLLYNTKNDKEDTIVSSTNIKNVTFVNDTINLFFYGKPKIYDNPVFIKNNFGKFKIIIDTTSISEGPQAPRKSYLKNE
ncbi:hypothetical protein [Flavobacterium sp.]|uniref:hypothetical protein n=1 Tax=Flavobacterium sp. TaxID=239 RepID=UPI002EDA70FF